MPISQGKTGDAINIFSFTPFIGYLVKDRIEIGVNPFGITFYNSGTNSLT